MGQWHIGRVAAGGNQDAAEARGIVARVESVPAPTEIDLHPSREIHRSPGFWQADVADIACAIAGRNVKRTAKGDSEMGKIAADAALLAVGLRSGARGPRIAVVEDDMVVNEVADRLDARNAERGVAKQPPGVVCQ